VTGPKGPVVSSDFVDLLKMLDMASAGREMGKGSLNASKPLATRSGKSRQVAKAYWT